MGNDTTIFYLDFRDETTKEQARKMMECLRKNHRPAYFRDRFI